MKKIKTISIAVLIIALVVLSGCEKARKGEEKMPERITLEEVRKEVIEQSKRLGYGELVYKNERRVKDIHEVMNYLMNKYDREFSYHDYHASTLLFPSTKAYFYPKGGDPKKDVFTVFLDYEDGKLIIEDRYMKIALRDKYSEYITKTVKSFNKEAKIVVLLPEIYAIHNKETTTVPERLSELDGLVSGSSEIFISDKNVGEEEYDRIIEEFKKWSIKHKMSTDTDFFYIRDKDMHGLNGKRAREFRKNKNYIKMDNIWVKDSDWE